MVTIYPIDPSYAAAGFCVGALIGMTGVGGGSLMTPLLILLFGVHPATAVGTDLLYAAATKTGGTFVHGLALQLRFSLEVSFLGCGLVGASPDRPCDDVSRADAPLRKPHRNAADLLNRPADQRAARAARSCIFGGGVVLA
jgi:hypothetical protein